jgi:two-component system, NarL family, nitrate/nitrite response regulator NarL
MRQSGNHKMKPLGGTVLVIDDDQSYRELLISLLERAGYATVGLPSGEEALASAEAERPALVILDVKLPGVSGYEVCRELKDAYGTSLPVIFVSGVRTEPFDRAAGLLVGADDYIVKPFDGDELLARVRNHLAPPAHLPRPDSTSSLTRRELEVLRLLADGLDQPEIADRLVISPKTVATHIQHILEKLGVHSRAQAVALAHRFDLNSPTR